MAAPKIEALIAAHVPHTHIKDVAAVYQHKWWDYRRMSPGHCFMLFTHCYYRAFRLAARKFLAYRARDHRMIALVGGGQVQFRADEIWERDKSHISGMWNAMMTADALGMPYDRFCAMAFQIALDTAWTRLPRPSQLYSDKLAAKTLQSWLDLRSERLMFAKHPLYRVENYAGTELQDSYREWLVDEIKNQSGAVQALAEVVYRNPQLPEAYAAQHFPAHAMNRARLIAA